jgi:hypothetical protein
MQPRRRFWVGFAVLSLLGEFGAALAALILHYTQKGPDEFGCASDTTPDGDETLYCTREMGTCNVLPHWKGLLESENQVFDRSWGISLACNETVSFHTCLVTRSHAESRDVIASGQVDTTRCHGHVRLLNCDLHSSSTDQEEDKISKGWEGCSAHWQGERL